MEYIAKKNEDKFTVTGIKEMTTIDGDLVKVEYATKDYDKQQLIDILEAYKTEKEQVIERYDNDIADMTKILDAINSI
jgi:hypothetical protein